MQHQSQQNIEDASAKVPVRLSHVTLAYDDGTLALSDISLEVKRGERLCVLGANGSGKSTLASVICGLLAPDEGHIELAGEQVFAGGTPDLAAYQRARRKLGLVFQNPDDQIVTSVVADDVAFGPENLGIPAGEIAERVQRELHRVALDAYAGADPSRLSGGQKQRVAIAGALAMEPEVLVLDEPGSLLDVRGRAAIMRVMGRLARAGTTLVHITHFMEEALEANRVVVLDHGRIALAGTPAEVFSEGAERLQALGLDQPFAATLSSKLSATGLPLRWTLDETALAEQLAEIAGCEKDTGESPQLDAGVFAPTTDSSAAGAGAEGAGTFRSNPMQRDPSPVRARTSQTLCPGFGGPASNGNSQQGHPKTSETRTSQTPFPGTGGPASNGQPQQGHPEPIIQVESVSFSYSPQSQALHNVSLKVTRGESVAIVGQTGSGKSTLLRLLCGLEQPDSGRILIAGNDTATKQGRRAARACVGYVMQHPERQLFAESVEADVAFGPRNLGLSAAEVERRVAGALEVVGLAEHREQAPFSLSGGQRRLAALAGILAMEPEVLILDEPTAGLDPRGRAMLRGVLARLQEGGTTLVQVTHSMNDAARADRVLVLDQSRAIMDGTPREVFTAANEPQLTAAGLGIPQALSFASELERRGMPSLAAPLTTDELVAAICANVAMPTTPQQGVS